MDDARKAIVREAVRRLAKWRPSLREVLYRILVAEASCQRMKREERLKNGFNAGCCWALWVPRLLRRDLEPLLEYEVVVPCGRLEPGKRSSPMVYRLVDLEATAEALGVDLERLGRESGGRVEEAAEAARRSRGGCTFPLSENAFEMVIGYEKVKKWIRRALCSKQPTHVMLYGAPGTAKTEIAKAVYDDLRKKGYPVKIVYVSSAGTTGTGLLEALINLPEYPEPSVLIIDEIDKVRDKKVLDVLAHVMEHQQFSVNKHGVDENYERNVWVIATANDITRLPPHLLDRFGVLKFYFPPYTKEQFMSLVPPMLEKMFGTPRELGRYIAEKLAAAGITSVREAREIAKVAETKEDVDELVEDIVKRRSGYWQWYTQAYKKRYL